MLDFFRDDLPWGTFWRLFEQIKGSQETYFSRAQRNDPELAASMAPQIIDDDSPWHPPAADWTSMHELMAQTRDRLGEIAALLADMPVAVKTRHKPPPAHARPLTALAAAIEALQADRDQAEIDKVDDFVARAKARYLQNQAERGDGWSGAVGEQ